MFLLLYVKPIEIWIWIMTSVRVWIYICVNKENNSASFWSLFPTPSLANRFITHKIHSIWMLRMIAVAMCCGVRLPGDHTRCRMLLLLLLLTAPGQQQPYKLSCACRHFYNWKFFCQQPYWPPCFRQWQHRATPQDQVQLQKVSAGESVMCIFIRM